MENGRIFKSIREAADWFGVKTTNICALLHGRGIAVKGFHFRYVDDSNDKIREESTRMEKCRKIICLETEQIFESITLAAQSLNISRGNIGEVLHGKRITAGGFHFRYLDEN